MILDKTHEIELIDNEIAETSEKERSLKSKRNSLTPISQLPTELLSRIFYLHAKDAIRYNKDNGVGKNWVSFTHVCRYWRRVVVETPNIWSTPDFSLPELALEMVARSKSAPLTLVTRGDPPDFQEKVEEIAEVLRKEHPRVHEIDIVFRDSSMNRLLSHMSTIEAPKLHRLALDTAFSQHGTPPLLPESLFRGVCPRLKCVSLRWGFDLSKSWSSFIFRNLISLRLAVSRFGMRGRAPLALDKLLIILRNCPELELLHLITCCEVAETLSVSSLAPVELPRLRRFHLADSPSMSSKLFELVSFPNLESISLSVDLPETSSGQAQVDLRGTMERLFHSREFSSSESRLTKLENPQSLSICTLSYSTYSAIVNFYTSSEPSVSTSKRLDSDANIGIRIDSKNRRSPSLPMLYESISTVLAAVPLSDLELVRAELADDTPLPAEVITSRLSHLSTLQHLVVTGMPAYVSFVDALGRCTGSGAFFMSLRTILFLKVGVGERYQASFAKHVDRESPGFRSAKERYGANFGVEHWLLTSLQMRKSVPGTVGIKKITLQWSPVLEELWELVGDIEIMDTDFN